MEMTKYRELVQALLTGSMDEHDRENAVKIALGEFADVWPKGIVNEPTKKECIR